MSGDIAGNVRLVRERMERAAERSGRDTQSVRLVAAAKTMSADRVSAAIAAGVQDIGQNYVQEAAEVMNNVDLPVRWHLIGHLQRNKAARAAAIFDVVQTVDRLSLGRALARRALALERTLSVCVEVNIGGEESKSGVSPEEVRDLVAALREESSLNVDGLMCIPPAISAEDARPYFRRMRRLAEAENLKELSMGMTNDYEIAIEEGATMVRVGRAIFGARS